MPNHQSKPCHVKDRNNPDWAPSLNLGYKKIKNVDTVIARYKSCSFDEIPTENIVSDFNSTSSYQEFINEEAEQVDENSCSFDEVPTENIVSDFNSTSSYQEFINEEVEQVEENSYSFDEITTENIIVPDFNSASSCQEFTNEEAEQVEENSYSFDEVTTVNIIVPDFNSTSSCQEFINEEAEQVEENSSHEFFSESNISTDSNIDSPPPERLDEFEEFYAEERDRKQVVNVLSFIVRLDSEKHIDFSLKSSFVGVRPKHVKRKNMCKVQNNGP